MRRYAAVVGLLVIAAILTTFGSAGPASAAKTAPSTAQTNVQYGEAGGERLLMDVYRAQGVSGPAPALILIHGGGFYRGDKSQMGAEGKFFQQHGYTCFSINYRLVPDFRYPAAYVDGQTAIKFIRTHASQFGIDPRRIGALGSSAGAAIADYDGLLGKGPLDVGARLAAVVSWSGPFEFAPLAHAPGTHNAIDLYTGLIERKGGPQTMSDQQAAEVLKAASPLTYVDPTDPPVFVANSKRELIPLDQAEMAINAFKQDRIPYTQLEPKRGHGVQYEAEALQPSLVFLDRYLKNGPIQTPGTGTGSVVSPVSPGTSPAPSGIVPSGREGRKHGRRGLRGLQPTGGSGSGVILPLAVLGGVVVLVLLIVWFVSRGQRPAKPR